MWNGFVEGGEDLQFYRPWEFMKDAAILEPPFYAIQMKPIFLNTDGGPVRNAKGQVIDVDGVPIPRLYAAGEFGSVWSHYYQGGCNLAECEAFGRICVRSMLQETSA